jgi:lysozyme family protein
MLFDTVFKRCISSEGGFTLNPNDSGNWTSGKIGVGVLNGTKFGIAANTYPDLDIKNLTIEQAKEIYYNDWWIKLGISKFSSAMQFQMFDAAFNHGMHNASKIYQRAVGAKDDGLIGEKTMSKASEISQDDKLLRFLAFRLKFYASLKSFDSFGRGWSIRVADNLLYASEDN